MVKNHTILKYKFYIPGILIFVGIVYFALIFKTPNAPNIESIAVFDKQETSIPTPATISNNKPVPGGVSLCLNFFEKTPANPLYGQDISHDGKLMAETEKTDLIIKRLSDGKVIRATSEHVSSDPTKNLTGFYKPRFSLDDSKVYFMTDAWTTSNAIHELEISTGETRFITDGYDLFVIPVGSENDTNDLIERKNYAGYLVVKHHKYFAGTGSYDWYWIINPKTGKDVGEPIGDSLADFFDVWVCPSRR